MISKKKVLLAAVAMASALSAPSHADNTFAKAQLLVARAH